MALDVVEKWQEIFASGKQLTKFPFSELVSLFYRFKPQLPAQFKVLELGSGPGANVPIFIEEAAEYHAIEGSQAAVDIVRKRFPSVQIQCGDFRKPLSFPDASFDLVVDRSAVTHNKEGVEQIFSEIHRVLKPSGLMIGVDYFGKEHSFYKKNNPAHEKSLFVTSDELMKLLNRFQILLLQENSKKTLLPENSPGDSITFDFVIQKRAR